MEEISSRPERDELGSYAPQKMYQPAIAWILFGIVTIAAAVYVMLQSRATDHAISTSGRNAISAATFQQTSGAVMGARDCATEGNESCITTSAGSYTNNTGGEVVNYVNNDYGIDLNYPANWSVVPDEPGGETTIYFRSADFAEDQDAVVSGSELSIGIAPNQSGDEIDDAYFTNAQQNISDGAKAQEISIDQHPAIMVSGGSEPIAKAYVHTKDRAYVMALEVPQHLRGRSAAVLQEIVATVDLLSKIR